MPPTMSNAGKSRASKFFCLCVLLLVSPSAAYAVDKDIIETMAGTWLVAPEDGTQGCMVKLGTGQAIGGYGIEEKAPCAATSPLHDNVAAWNFDGNGGVIFLDPLRKVLLRLEEQEGGPYKTPQDATPAMLMVKPPSGVDRVPMAQNLFGAWALQDKKGKPVCGVILQEHPPQGGEESFALELSKDCSSSLRKLKLASWRISDFQLEFDGSDGESLMLTPQANGDFTAEDQGYIFSRVKS